MFKRSRALASVALIAVTAGLAAPAWAETLQEAIALAYRTNPTLQGQRASQRALDEVVPQARAGLRPTLSVSGSASYVNRDARTPGVDINGDGVDDIPSSRNSTDTRFDRRHASAWTRPCTPAVASRAASTPPRPRS